MFDSEGITQKNIVTPDGEEEFQIRFVRREQVGVLTTRSDKSWFILDSKDYWYDLIQQNYPTRTKCRCKNDYFKLHFDYVPRIHTDDYRAVELYACCTQCGKQKNLGTIDIDFSPSAYLFAHPLTSCKQPKLKCKTYSIKGYWTDEKLRDLTSFLMEKLPFLYCWYYHQPDQKRYLKQLTKEELKQFLFDGSRYITLFFSKEPLNTDQAPHASDGRGVYVKDAIWRKKEVFKLNSPFLVVGYGYFYSMEFCSEYIDQDGQIQPKSASFSKFVQEVRAHGKKVLHPK